MVEIHDWKEEGDFATNGIIATFDAYLPEEKLTLRNIKIAQSKAGKPYIRFPSYMSGEGADGKKEFGKLWEFVKEKQDRLLALLKQEAKIYKPTLNL